MMQDKQAKIQALINGAKTPGEKAAAQSALIRVKAANPKNQAAVELGRKGGSAMVPKGFAKMSSRKRTEAAKKGAAMRWRDA